MKNRAMHITQESRRVKPWMYIAAMLINVAVLTVIGAVYVSANRYYSNKLFEENIHNVENLNIASANAAYTYTNGMGIKIDDVTSFIKSQKLSYEDVVNYLGEANTDPTRQFQLIRSDAVVPGAQVDRYRGVSIRKVMNSGGKLDTQLCDIEYDSSYDDVFRAFTDLDDVGLSGVCFAPEFTDPDTKLKCFAVYRHLELTDAVGQRAVYTVFIAVNSQSALNAYDVKTKYEGQSTVLVNADGDYIIKSSDFRNDSFYDYIVNYNGLAPELREGLRAEILDGSSDGEPVNLFYKNHQGADCVFSTVAIENGWYSITCVPLDSFDLENADVNYSLVILMLFLVLFAIDGFFIFYVGRIMRFNIAVAERATNRAREASQAKSRFLSTTSHELRTPLNAIIGLVSLSADRLDDPSVLKDYLKKIDISSKLLLQLISDILDVSAIESNKLKLNESEFDITRLISSMSAIYYDQCAAKSIEFRVVLKDMHSEILIGDSVRVKQVLLNFLSNAVKFTPSGGKVILSAEQTDRSEEAVVIRFTIGDTGCGISEELKKRLFRPFERASGETARRHSGTGLGLSIAKSIVELMGGQVGVESEEGSGSSFWAEIPFRLPEQTPRRSQSPIDGISVLAAVSDEGEREYIGQALASFGVERVLTGSAEGALELLRERAENRTPIDLCILDWKLPDLMGIDAAGKITSEFGSSAPRIVLLAYDLAEASSRSAEVDTCSVLGKPVFLSALYNLLVSISAPAPLVPDEVPGCGELAGKRVLLVEDNAMNTEIACLLLNRVGIEVETAENGREGCDRFNASPPGYYSAILMDVQMPVMDGYQATETIRAGLHPQAPTIPILAMTADAFTEDVEKAREAGMNEHISKPVVPENLYAVLKKHLCNGL